MMLCMRLTFINAILKGLSRSSYYLSTESIDGHHCQKGFLDRSCTTIAGTLHSDVLLLEFFGVFIDHHFQNNHVSSLGPDLLLP